MWNASGVGQGAPLLQTKEGTTCYRDGTADKNILRSIAFVSKSLSALKRTYSNIERVVLVILHDLQKPDHY